MLGHTLAWAPLDLQGHPLDKLPVLERVQIPERRSSRSEYQRVVAQLQRAVHRSPQKDVGSRRPVDAADLRDAQEEISMDSLWGTRPCMRVGARGPPLGRRRTRFVARPNEHADCSMRAGECVEPEQRVARGPG